KNGAYWVLRGDLYRNKGDIQKTRADYDMAVKNPTLEKPTIGLQQRAILNEDLREWEAAIRDWPDAQNQFPKNSYISSNLFRLLIDCPDPALRDVRRALALDKEYGPLLNGAPDERRRLIVSACRQAIRLMPDREEYRKELLANLDNLDERIAACTDWIESGPA